ncbi:MAG: DUF58 domain-containing protein [Pyrinomonadaceae bacterium]|nr:DUF58 domain-containing protein [Pyrinomonadaceae bacterium]
MENDTTARISESPSPRVSASSRLPVSSSFFSRWRNAFFGTLLVLAGLASALVSVLARQTNDNRLSALGALLSVIIAGLILVFVVPPLARSARLEMAGLDLPIEVTTGGAIFIAIVLIVGLAAWNTGNNLLFLVFALLCSTLLVGWVAARTSLRDLVVSARFPDHIFAGEPAPVIVTLRNTKRFMPSFSVMVEARGPASSKAGRKRRLKRKPHHKRALAYFTYVPHGAAAEQRVEQLFPERGHVFINGFELSTRFPFGFVRRRRRLKARNVDIVVYPKPEPIGDELHLLPMYAGRMASMRRGAGHDLFALRDYQAQDDLRHIDWKATARARRLTVREFTSEDERRITIILDTRPVSESALGSLHERFERGVIRAASHLKHFIDEGAEVRLILGTDVGPSGSGLEHLYHCLRRLAVVRPQDSLVDPDLTSSAAEIETAQRSRSVSGDDYSILLTTAAPGSIPAKIWRSSYVIYL